MAKTNVPRVRDAEAIRTILDSAEVSALTADLQATRWTGRPGYPIRAMVGMALVKGYYALPTWTRTAALVREHDALRAVLGGTPSIDACYRFTVKLRDHADRLTECIERVLTALHDEMPEMGQTVAIDGSDLPVYANGQRFLSKGGKERKVYSDPDASWGHRSAVSTRKGGGFYGYKVHAAVCTTTGLPVAWRVETARDHEVPIAPDLLDAVTVRGFDMTYAVLDKGYDAASVYEACESRGIRPIVLARLATLSPGRFGTSLPHSGIRSLVGLRGFNAAWMGPPRGFLSDHQAVTTRSRSCGILVTMGFADRIADPPTPRLPSVRKRTLARSHFQASVLCEWSRTPGAFADSCALVQMVLSGPHPLRHGHDAPGPLEDRANVKAPDFHETRRHSPRDPGDHGDGWASTGASASTPWVPQKTAPRSFAPKASRPSPAPFPSSGEHARPPRGSSRARRTGGEPMTG